MGKVLIITRTLSVKFSAFPKIQHNAIHNSK